MKLLITSAGALGAAFFLLSGAPALAQSEGGAKASSGNFDRDRSASVRGRSRPGYEPLGMRWGMFSVSPSLGLSVNTTDNVLAVSSGEESDTYLEIAPSVAVQSDWSRHSLSFYANGASGRYDELPGENYDNYEVGAAGRVDVVTGASFGGGVSLSRAVEPRSSSSSPDIAAEPVTYDTRKLTLEGQRAFNRLRLAARYTNQETEYDDVSTFNGGVLDQSYRDRTVETLLLRGDYALGPDTAIFIENTFNKRDYKAAGSDRNSDGYEVLVGANFELTNLVRGELGVGYLRQNYDSSAYKDVDGFSARGKLEWFPSGLTTVTLSGDHTINESSILGAAGYLTDTVSVQVDHELLRNLILTGTGFVARDDYVGIDRKDDRFGYTLGASYLMNRRVAVDVTFAHLSQDSSMTVMDADYDINTLRVGLTLRY